MSELSNPSVDFYIRETNDFTDFVPNQNVLIKKCHLSYFGIDYKDKLNVVPSPCLEWYPFVNSYYQYTEDVDAFARVNHLLEDPPIVSSNISFFTNCAIQQNEKVPYSDKDIQYEYLQSKPISFWITGKPGIGQEELGKQLSEYWRCVYIDPKVLIEEEIISNTRAGQCIEFNLRCGRAIGIDVILRLLEKRVRTKSAEHRGFVICGFPLIPNDMYKEDPLSSESAVFTVQEIFEELLDTTVEIGVAPQKNVSQTSKVRVEEESVNEEQEDEEKLGPEDHAETAVAMVLKKASIHIPLDVGSVRENICRLPEIGTNYAEQLNFIIAMFDDPFIIIYIMCPNADVVTKHKNMRYDAYMEENINLLKEKAEKMMYTIFSHEIGAANEDVPEGFFDPVGNEMSMNASSRHLVLLPNDFDYNVVSQLNRYYFEAMPAIEKLVLLHDQQYFIKVDGRTSISRMLNVIKTKLRTLPLQKVLIPERLDLPLDDFGEGGPAEAEEENEDTPEGVFKNFRRRRIVNRMFKWNWSDWGPKCPVSMKEGLYVDGEPQFAVQFMDKIFFLKDETAYIKFYRNPRPYLLPPYPRISCRIFVMGPKFSGKSSVSKCLAYLLDGEIICPQKLTKEFLRKQEIEFRERIRTKALNEGVMVVSQKRREEWQALEDTKKREVNEWIQNFRNLLERRVEFEREMKEEQRIEDPSFSSLRTTSKTSKKFPTIEELKQNYETMRVPFIDDIKLCIKVAKNKETLMKYLPEDLKPQPFTETTTIFDPFVQEYADNAVENAIFRETTLTLDELCEMYGNKIKEIEDNNENMGKVRGGWIVDGFPPNKALIEKLSPESMADHVIVLIDDDYHQFLLNRFGTVGCTRFYEFRNFFLSLGNKDAAWRSPSGSTDSFKTTLAEDMINLMLQSEKFLPEELTEEELDNEKLMHQYKLKMYSNEIINFYDEWNELSQYLVQENIEPFEINIADKSIEDVLKDVVKIVEDQYRQLPSLFTAEDREEELLDFGEPNGNDEMGDEEEMEEGDDTFLLNRRYGDTYHYCPVTFHEKWVLWKGKEEFAVKFDNRLYFMCSEEAMNDFLENPRKYLLIENPVKSFPPPRICVIGPPGSGKTSVSKAISNNLGLYYVSFENVLKYEVDPTTNMNLKDLLAKHKDDPDVEIIEEYLTSDTPLPLNMLSKILNRLWFEEPIKSIGFVLDGFPNRPTDIEFMENHKFIPDLVLELSANEEYIHGRRLFELVEEWKNKMAREQEKFEILKQATLEEWEEKRLNRYRSLLDLKRQERYLAKVAKKEQLKQTEERPYLEDLEEVDEDLELGSPKSMISFDSVADAADIAEVEKILSQELPEPVFEEDWEPLEEAAERISVEIDDKYNSEAEFIRFMHESSENEQIPWSAIDANFSLDKVISQAYRTVNPFKFRNESMFERCYDVTVDVAEKLLESGYYFLSKFGRTCPVQYYLKHNPIQMLLPLEQRFQIYPILHRRYIYFLAGLKNRDIFKENPLKYVNQQNVRFPLVPFRVAITGAPKCGKTCLAERFKKEFGMKVISRGQAARYVLKFLPFSQLAENMEDVLRKGWNLTDEMVIRSVEAFAFDGRAITQGIVFDGFPNSQREIKHMAQVGLTPNLVIDLRAVQEDVHMCLESDVGKRNFPLYSKRFIDYRFIEWAIYEDDYRDWLDKEYQNLIKIPIKPSKWGIWTAAQKVSLDVISEVKHYHKCACNDWPLRLAHMLISPLEYLERKSDYKHYCPGCWKFFSKLRTGGEPPDRTGLIQYRKYFYWLCWQHAEDFIKCPDQYLTPYNKSLPSDLPERIYLSEVPDNVYERGYCVVCYRDNRPRYVRKAGSINYAVFYKGRVLLFDSLSCLKKFCCDPLVYFSTTINFFSAHYPPLEYQDLPTLGLLEQYLARQVCKAVTNTGILRPLIPGLSIDDSASINMGLFLKLHNPETKEAYIPMYKRAHELFMTRRNKLIAYLAQMKKQINPYLYYEEPIPEFSLPPAPPPALLPKTASTESTEQAMRYIVYDVLDEISYTDEDYFV